MNEYEIFINEQCLDSILPYIGKYDDIIEKELLEFFKENIVFRNSDKIPHNKKITVIKIKDNKEHDNIYFNTEIILNGEEIYNTLCFYDKERKHWKFFWANISDKDKLKLCNFAESSLVRKIKIYKLLKNE